MGFGHDAAAILKETELELEQAEKDWLDEMKWAQGRLLWYFEFAHETARKVMSALDVSAGSDLLSAAWAAVNVTADHTRKITQAVERAGKE